MLSSTMQMVVYNSQFFRTLSIGFDCLVRTQWHSEYILMSLTRSQTQKPAFERLTKDFEQETGFCRPSMVFCHLLKLFWEWTLYFGNCERDSRNAPNQLRKTVTLSHTHNTHTTHTHTHTHTVCLGHSAFWHKCPSYLEHQKKLKKSIPYWTRPRVLWIHPRQSVCPSVLNVSWARTEKIVGWLVGPLVG